MKTTLIMAIGIALYGGLPAFGQGFTSTYELRCSGSFHDRPAEMYGRRIHEAYNSLGDGTISFVGVLRTHSGQYRLVYEDYVNLAPYDGYIELLDGPNKGYSYKVEILDHVDYGSGPEFIISDGSPTLYAPNEYGRLVCQWREVRSGR